ncbi:uncharacterized protein LOC125674769 isoform X1 [Ostrea edulis]|uniref:uncharacterized protein LOC125674769 isoform X1 n=1 Tax=Ostrea edulis TaxID=37623 RepID=UPI0024AF3A56|nr:uncharacterized protein LOC125674769 isoform X1 [Ostrea edulis]
MYSSHFNDDIICTAKIDGKGDMNQIDKNPYNAIITAIRFIHSFLVVPANSKELKPDLLLEGRALYHSATASMTSLGQKSFIHLLALVGKTPELPSYRAPPLWTPKVVRKRKVDRRSDWSLTENLCDGI